MSSLCITEPVSFLRLERYLLDELSSDERTHVSRHLDACGACRACLEGLRASQVSLPPLPAPSLQRGAGKDARAARPRARFTRPLGVISALAAAALVALLLRPGVQPAELPPAHRFIKGGELAIGLVRERDGQIANDPTRFAPGDRFAVRLTCPPGEVYWELAVFQAGEVFFPLPPGAPLSCGNLVPLDGAFTLTGDEPATVCAIVDAAGPVRRAQLRAIAALPPDSVCVQLLRAQP